MTQDSPTSTTSSPNSPSPPPSEQRIVIKQLQLDTPSKEGSKWYLISQKWWDLWKNYVNYDENEDKQDNSLVSQHLDPIDNNTLIDDNQQLRFGLLEGQDYCLVYESVWKTLMEWYGGGPPIQRRMIAVGIHKTTFEVEVYPMIVTLLKVDAIGQEPQVQMPCSKNSTVKDFRERIAMRYATAPHKCVLWLEGRDGRYKKLSSAEDLQSTVEDAMVSGTGRLILEVESPSPHMVSWKDENQIAKTIREQDQKLGTKIVRKGIEPGGKASMPATIVPQKIVETSKNEFDLLGFMNSALQCLSFTMPLTTYFLSDSFQKDVNPTNPLGMQGKIAQHYAALLKRLWAGNTNSIAPSDFKWILGKFAPQFSGFRQHDSQELLAFLLDGLHEDLNRVIDKPYTSSVDTHGKDDEVASKESWEVHLKRNQSIIVDLFQGQLKSTLVCPNKACNNISITFDPFMYLSLPLPITSERVIEVFVFHLDKPHPVKYAVKVPKKGKILQLKQVLSDWSNINVNNLILADIDRGRIYTLLEDQKPISAIRDSDVTVGYELLDKSQHSTILHLVHRKKDLANQEQGQTSNTSSSSLFGFPLIVSVPPLSSNSALYDFIWQRVKFHIVDDEKLLADIGGAPFTLSKADHSSLLGYSKEKQAQNTIKNDDSKVVLYNHQSLFIDWPKKFLELYVKKAEPKCLQHMPSYELSKEKTDNGISLYDCFQLFLATEQLGAEDTWFCPKCRQDQEATKKFDIFQLPEILVVHLKRFQYTRSWREKIDIPVDYPVNNLDLSPYVKSGGQQEYLYDLFAISHHSGGLGGGHYVAYVKRQDGDWYNFNDSSCTKVSETSVQRLKGAYVLFYRRKREPNFD